MSLAPPYGQHERDSSEWVGEEPQMEVSENNEASTDEEGPLLLAVPGPVYECASTDLGLRADDIFANRDIGTSSTSVHLPLPLAISFLSIGNVIARAQPVPLHDIR